MRDLREQFWYDIESFPSRQRWMITIYSAPKNTEGKSTKVLAASLASREDKHPAPDDSDGFQAAIKHVQRSPGEQFF